MRYYYLGAFPIEGGGVTIKNNAIYTFLIENGYNIKKIDLNIINRNHDITEMIRLIGAIIFGQAFIVGLSGTRGKSRQLTKLLYLFRRRALRNSLYFMMGGTEAKIISENKNFIKWYQEYKAVYVETETMKKTLCGSGQIKAKIYPNCRKRPKESIDVKKTNDKLKGVFFSYIHPDKGVDIILKVAKKITDVEFYFYGHIYEEYADEFNNAVDELPNVSYCGIFRGTDEDTYKELAKYDVLLLPTKYKNEGVPGIIVESKIAGIPAIVSNVSFNSELVIHNEEGIVLDYNNEEELSMAMVKLLEDRRLLDYYKQKAKESAERFFMDNYYSTIEEEITR